MNAALTEALKVRERRPPVIDTIARLTAIKPGERIRYYSGQKGDTANSSILLQVFLCAEELRAHGRAELREEARKVATRDKFGLPVIITVMDFIAVGK